MDQGRLLGAAADTGRARCARGVQAAGWGARPGEGGRRPRRTWRWALPDFGLGASPSSGAAPSARFPSGHCPLPSHGVICLLSLRFQSPLGHPLHTVTHFVPAPHSAPPRAPPPRLCPRGCCRPRGQALRPGEPSGHLGSLPGGAGGKFPPRPFPGDQTWRRPRPGRRREGRPGSRAPSPSAELARSVCLSASAEPRRRRRGGGGGSWGRISIEINNQAAVINTGTWRPQPQPRLQRRRSAPTAAGT